MINLDTRGTWTGEPDKGCCCWCRFRESRREEGTRGTLKGDALRAVFDGAGARASESLAGGREAGTGG